MAKKTNNSCICRIFARDIPILAKEFKLDYEAIKKDVSKRDKYRKFDLGNGVYLVKYYVTSVPLRMCNLHNYYLHGDRKHIEDILSKSCGVRARGCYIPLLPS